MLEDIVYKTQLLQDSSSILFSHVLVEKFIQTSSKLQLTLFQIMAKREVTFIENLMWLNDISFVLVTYYSTSYALSCWLLTWFSKNGKSVHFNKDCPIDCPFLCSLTMGTLALETDDVSSDIYLSLGLKELDKGVGVPRVLSLLSSLLERSVQRNEMLLEAKQIKDVVTVFHGLRAPTLSVCKYIDRIFKYSGCSPSCFVVAHIYVDRLLQHTEIKLTSLNIHRLLITSIMLAAKFMDDAWVQVWT